FTTLIRVDLPEPEGPQITTTSPLDTVVLQSFSTCVVPYHLLTFLSSIMPSPLSLCIKRVLFKPTQVSSGLLPYAAVNNEPAAMRNNKLQNKPPPQRHTFQVSGHHVAPP